MRLASELQHEGWEEVDVDFERCEKVATVFDSQHPFIEFVRWATTPKLWGRLHRHKDSDDTIAAVDDKRVG